MLKSKKYKEEYIKEKARLDAEEHKQWEGIFKSCGCAILIPLVIIIVFFLIISSLC